MVCNIIVQVHGQIIKGRYVTIPTNMKIHLNAALFTDLIIINKGFVKVKDYLLQNYVSGDPFHTFNSGHLMYDISLRLYSIEEYIMSYGIFDYDEIPNDLEFNINEKKTESLKDYYKNMLKPFDEKFGEDFKGEISLFDFLTILPKGKEYNIIIASCLKIKDLELNKCKYMKYPSLDKEYYTNIFNKQFNASFLGINQQWPSKSYIHNNMQYTFYIIKNRQVEILNILNNYKFLILIKNEYNFTLTNDNTINDDNFIEFLENNFTLTNDNTINDNTELWIESAELNFKYPNYVKIDYNSNNCNRVYSKDNIDVTEYFKNNTKGLFFEFNWFEFKEEMENFPELMNKKLLLCKDDDFVLLGDLTLCCIIMLWCIFKKKECEIEFDEQDNEYNNMLQDVLAYIN